MPPWRYPLRRLWLDIHLWIGVGLGLLLIVVGVSGSLLVWHDDLDALLYPERYAVSAGGPLLAPSRYLAAAAFGPAVRATAVRLPEHAGLPVTVSGSVPGQGRAGAVTAWLDPSTATVLDNGSAHDSVIGFLHRLHGSLALADFSGRQIVGWAGVVMLISSLTGIWLWWPGGSLLRALGWRRGTRPTVNLHHVTGIWVAIPLAVLSLTGIYLSFPQTGRATLETVAAMSPPQQRAGFGGEPLAAPALAPDAVAAAALALAGEAELAALFLPGQERPVWRAQLRRPGGETVTVLVEDSSGAATLQASSGVPAQGDVIARWIRRIHDGQQMGPLWQAIVFLGGFAPALLMVTGTMMWLRKRRSRRTLDRRRAAALAGAASR